MKRERRYLRRNKSGMTQFDRRIEHQRRRARLKREPLDQAAKTERFHERWDKWNWD